MKCKRCGDCCKHMGSVPTARDADWLRMRTGTREVVKWLLDHVPGRGDAPDDLSCPMLTYDFDLCAYKCGIYDERPDVCRSYEPTAECEGRAGVMSDEAYELQKEAKT